MTDQLEELSLAQIWSVDKKTNLPSGAEVPKFEKKKLCYFLPKSRFQTLVFCFFAFQRLFFVLWIWGNEQNIDTKFHNRPSILKKWGNWGRAMFFPPTLGKEEGRGAWRNNSSEITHKTFTKCYGNWTVFEYGKKRTKMVGKIRRSSSVGK